ncbi:MAG: DUF202 domain-containing protein [Actinomycetes bacterium]
MTVPTGATSFVERTALAWRRTGLALFVLTVASAKVADAASFPVVGIAALVVGAAALACVFVAERHVVTGRTSGPWGFLAASALLCCGVAALGVLMSLPLGGG